MTDLKTYKECLDYIQALYPILAIDYTARATGQPPVKDLAKEMDRFGAVVVLLKGVILSSPRENVVALTDLQHRIQLMMDIPDYEPYLAGAGVFPGQLDDPAFEIQLAKLRAESKAFEAEGQAYYALFCLGTKDLALDACIDQGFHIGSRFNSLVEPLRKRDSDPCLFLVELVEDFCEEHIRDTLSFFMAGYGVSVIMLDKIAHKDLLIKIYKKYKDLKTSHYGNYNSMMYLWEGMRARAEET